MTVVCPKKTKEHRYYKDYSTCISSVFPNIQFVSGFLIAQSKVSVLSKSSGTTVVPQVDPHGPLLHLVLGQRENLLQPKPVVL